MISQPVLLDTGPLVAILSKHDQYHEPCCEVAKQLSGPQYTCVPVITEAAWLLRNIHDGLNRLLELCDGTTLQLLSIRENDLPEIRAISDNYADQHFQFADLCLMYLSQRERISHVFTLDQRHFSVYRTTRGQSLTLLTGTP